MKTKLILILIPMFLTACINPNDRVFQGKSYELVVAEMGTNNKALFRYEPYDRSGVPHVIFVDKLNITENYANHYVNDWYKQEQEYRKNDCKLQHKVYQEIKYATCDFKNGSKYVIYVLKTTNNQGIANTYLSVQKQSENDEHRLVLELNKFYP